MDYSPLPSSRLAGHLAVVSFSIILGLVIYKFLLDPLRSIPGPLAAKFSNLWYLLRLRRGYFHKDNIALHERHGPVLRYGPSRVSISDPVSVKKVYGLGSSGLNKSSWYDGWNKPGVRSIFTERDTHVHAQMRRKFASTYSMTSMTSYEQFVDECITLLCQRFDEIATSKSFKSLNLAWWTECFAADTVSMVTYSKRMGFLDAGKDIEALMAFLHANLRRSAQMGVYSWITPYAVKGFGILSALRGDSNPISFVRDFAVRAIGERTKSRASSNGTDVRKSDGEDEDGTPRDFLDKFLDFHERDPEKFEKMDITIG